SEGVVGGRGVCGWGGAEKAGRAGMGQIRDDWFAPATLFDEGYPEELTSALRALPTVRAAVAGEIAALGARRVLEIGPGDAPVATGELVVYLDVAPGFLRRLTGARVVGDLFAAPFAADAFALGVARDVETRVRPPRRSEALAAIAALAPRVVLFNPEPGTAEVVGSRSPTAPIVAFFEAAGWKVRARTFAAAAQ